MERPCPSSETLVTPDSGVGGPPYATGGAPCSPRSPNLQRRNCRMPDGRPPHPYYVDPDTGMSYWEPLTPEVSTPAAAAPRKMVEAAARGAAGPASAASQSTPKEWTVAKPSTVGMWSPRGVVAAEGGVISMPLLAPTVAKTGGGAGTSSQEQTEQAEGTSGGE
ncbi:hypothetical protein MMPV_009346 [Pyropia vietnamensis]